MKKYFSKVFLIMSVVMAAVVYIAFSVSALDAKGQCGENVYWDFNSKTGELVISGSGDMEDYVWNGSPFFSLENIKKVIVEDGITSLGSYVFQECKNIESIEIGDSVKEIGRCAMADCINIGVLEIPDSVISIYNGAFLGCEKLNTIIMPDTITHIGANAFSETSFIEQKDNWDGKVLYIGKYLITAKTDLSGKYTVKKGTTVIAERAFYSCEELADVIIPDGVKYLNPEAFEYCYNLKNVNIPNSVIDIGYSAFFCCRGLTDIKIPDSVKNIDDGAFADCSCLTNVTMPSSIKEISESMFFDCINLQSITIPSSVNTIGEDAFSYCSNLRDIYFNGSKTQWQRIKILDGNDFSNVTIHFNNHSHTYKSTTTKATLTKSGKTVYKCSCGDIQKTEIIPRVGSVTLSSTEFVYDGKNKTPKVEVKDYKGKALVKNVDYKLSVVSNRSVIGRYTVKVTFIGNYEGYKYLYFYIRPGKPASVKSDSQTTSSVKLSWSKVPGAAGYTVYRYSPSRRAYVKAGTTNGISYTVKNLNAGTKYTFRVVAYGKTASGKIYDSNSYILLKTATKSKTPSITKLTSSKGKASFTWSNVSGESGYQIYYSEKKDSGYKKVASYKANTLNGSKSNLTSGKTYYFKVRTYIKTDSGYVYSAWSSIKSIKVK